MGAFFVNYQIRSTDQAAVADIAGQLVQIRGYVSPPKNGWVTLYDEASESQDAYEIGRVGSDLSAALNTAVFAFLVSDSTLFVYYLFENGDLNDEYHSTPVPTNAAAEADQKNRFIGRPDLLLKYCLPGTTRSDVELPLLRGESLVEGGFASSMSAEERLHPLAAMLGMDDQRTSMGYIDFDRRWSSIPDGNLFQKIDGRKFNRTVKRRLPPNVPHRPR
jgi:hypothetical protein